MSNLFKAALARANEQRPPVWFMRQAGRYHSHYRGLRAEHSFMDLCKRPELATAITLGPLEAFDFDAAILFSDLLFPLEALGMPLSYEPAGTFASSRTWDVSMARGTVSSGSNSRATPCASSASACRSPKACWALSAARSHSSSMRLRALTTRTWAPRMPGCRTAVTRASAPS